jgi:hypothetical protein
MIAAWLGLNPLGPRAGIRRSIVVITNKGITPIVQPNAAGKIKKSAIGKGPVKIFYFAPIKAAVRHALRFRPRVRLVKPI